MSEMISPAEDKTVVDFTPEQWQVDPVRCSLWFPSEKQDDDQWHRHLDFYELVILLEGTVWDDSPVGQEMYKPGDFLIYAPGSVHHYSRLRNSRYYNVLFLPETVTELTGIPGMETLLVRTGRSSLYHLGNTLLAQASAIAEDMHRESVQKNPGWKLCLKAQLSRLLIFLLRGADKTEESQLDSLAWRITCSIRFMEKRLAEKITLAQLAAVSSMSLSSYRHNFKNITGYSPKNYLLLLRLKNACRMLFSGKNIAETALASGFEEREYFSRMFKKYTNFSPSAAAERMHNDEKQLHKLIEELWQKK